MELFLVYYSHSDKWRYNLRRSSELVRQRVRPLSLTYCSQMIILSSPHSSITVPGVWVLVLTLLHLNLIQPFLKLKADVILNQNSWRPDEVRIVHHVFGTLWELSTIILCKIFVLNYSHFDYRPSLNSDNPWNWIRRECVKRLFSKHFCLFPASTIYDLRLRPEKAATK